MHIRTLTLLLLLFLGLAPLPGCATGRHGDADLPNFQQVSDGLYRGGQPTRAGVQRLNAMGVKTIINIRRSDTDGDLLSDHAFEYHRRGMSPWSPSDEDVLWFLTLATSEDAGPVFLHCHHGSDRTGYLIAMYRMVVEGWDRQQAIDEMTAHGNGFHDIFQGLISYVERADVEELRKAIGVRTTRRPSPSERLPDPAGSGLQAQAPHHQADSQSANQSSSE